MAEIKISELTEATSTNDGDLFVIVQDDITKKVLKSNITGITGDGFNEPTELTINSGAVSVSGSVKWRFHSIDTEDGIASDDLDTINGGNIGDILILQAVNSEHTVVCKDGTSLKLQGEFSLNNSEDKLMLICVAANVWHEIGRSSSGD